MPRRSLNLSQRRRRQRITFLVLGLSLAAGALVFALWALRSSVVYFFSPTELSERALQKDERLRVGGVVVEGSIRQKDQDVEFTVTDFVTSVEVSYHGALPDLFRAGQGVVVEGYRTGPTHVFAETVLAKHDETYMPPEVAEAIKRAGVWRAASEVSSPQGNNTPSTKSPTP